MEKEKWNVKKVTGTWLEEINKKCKRGWKKGSRDLLDLDKSCGLVNARTRTYVWENLCPLYASWDINKTTRAWLEKFHACFCVRVLFMEKRKVKNKKRQEKEKRKPNWKSNRSTWFVHFSLLSFFLLSFFFLFFHYFFTTFPLFFFVYIYIKRPSNVIATRDEVNDLSSFPSPSPSFFHCTLNLFLFSFPLASFVRRIAFLTTTKSSLLPFDAIVHDSIDRYIIWK